MATSSIFNTICIDSKEKAERFVRALEESDKTEQKAVKKRKPLNVNVFPTNDEMKSFLRNWSEKHR